MRGFGRTSAVHSRGYLTGTGVVGNITGAGDDDNLDILRDLFNGDEDEMLQVGMLWSIGMQQSSMGDENNHTAGNGTITSKTVTERVRKRASDEYFSNDIVTPMKRKHAGKVRKGLATSNPLYTSVIEDASPGMGSEEVYRRSLFAAKDNHTPQKKSRKKKEGSPTSDSSVSER